MNPLPDHAVTCPRGPLRNILHNQVSDEVAAVVEECGARARREAFVAEFTAATGHDAFLDVWGFGKTGVTDLLVDVTIRHEAAERYAERGLADPEAAARQAVRDKMRRYPPTGGRNVTTFMAGGWGRLGSEAETLLTTLAGVAAGARECVARAGGAAAPRRGQEHRRVQLRSAPLGGAPRRRAHRGGQGVTCENTDRSVITMLTRDSAQ